MRCSVGISNFLAGISSLSHSSISLHCSLRKAFLSLLAIFWNFAFRWVYCSFTALLFASLLFSAICKASSDRQPFCLFCTSFSWGWFWSPPPVQCYESHKGNGGNGNLLQKDLCQHAAAPRTVAVSASDPMAGHSQPIPPREILGHSQEKMSTHPSTAPSYSDLPVPPSGSFHKSLILIHQRAEKMKTTITEN